MNLSVRASRHDGHNNEVQNLYRFGVLRNFIHNVLLILPPAWREYWAELFLRRAGAPAPAMEHVFQYRLSLLKVRRKDRAVREATVAKAADNFYVKQYRQFLNVKMSVFAATAVQAAIASASRSRSWLWWRHRRTTSAIIELPERVPPILVIDKQTVAVAVMLPTLKRHQEAATLEPWLRRHGPMPGYYRALMTGRKPGSLARGTHACERSAAGSAIEVIDTAIRLRKLALLALHPYDVDAMGLHITLFDVQAVSADQLESEHGLHTSFLHEHRSIAYLKNFQLLFLVGCTEEVFTQCSQNLFIKRPTTTKTSIAIQQPPTWTPKHGLSRLLDRQFELLQVTVSASGLPGVSPRNGDFGRAGFIAHELNRPCLLIPYFPGNAVHGHAAKLLSNPYGTVIVSDDHDMLTRVYLSGRCTTVSHAWVSRRFPDITQSISGQRNHHGDPLADPEYWFMQEVQDIVQETESLSANQLDPARPTCSISAGGRARHNKKPAYFEADKLPGFDMHLLHKRERAGRVIDRTGAEHRSWRSAMEQPLQERQACLAKLNMTSAD